MFLFFWWQLKNKFISQVQNLINSNLKKCICLKSYMLLTSNSFLFLFLPFSLLINLFSVSKTTKTLYLGVLSAYFYYIDNGYLLIILLFLATLLKFQIDKNIFNTPLFITLLLTPLIIFLLVFLFLRFNPLRTILTKEELKTLRVGLKFLHSWLFFHNY